MKPAMNETKDFEYVPSRLVISAAQDRGISEMLTKLKKQAPARLVLLADRNGQTIYNSENSNESWLVELAALMAGDLAASAEIARLMKNVEDRQLILREGEHQHSYVAEAGPHLVLFVQTTSEVPLGWSRLLVQEAVQELGVLLAGAEMETDDSDKNFTPQEMEQSLNEAIDGLLN